MDRDAALDRVEQLIETVESEELPVPIREVWVYGDVALGLDPVERLDVYVTKDILLRGDDAGAADEFERTHGVEGVGKTVRAEWAEQFPEYLRANDNGYAAPERCLAAELVDDEPIHLEVCNASFEDNVRQRLKGALARDAYEEVLDPRGVCLWVDGTRDEEAFDRLREASLAMPTLPAALGMLGADEDVAREAADVVKRERAEQEGPSVRGDMV